MGLGTPLCQRLGIKHPVWCAGMSAAAGPELVAAVSNAGGLGVLGATGDSSESVQRRAVRARELTNRPFGVNFIIDQADALCGSRTAGWSARPGSPLAGQCRQV